MARILLQSILLFLLPFIGYALYVWMMRRGDALLENAPWFWLTASGLGIACGALILLAVTGGTDPDVVYQPPHMDPSGEIVPGGFRPADGQ
jgi:hypothetical protein